ncbi:MAG: hypothetical protein ACXVBY_22200, partial [Isosphaeraceae bacterium]
MVKGEWQTAKGWLAEADELRLSASLSCVMFLCHAAINRFLRQCGIDDDIGGDLECRLVGVALAVESG